MKNLRKPCNQLSLGFIQKLNTALLHDEQSFLTMQIRSQNETIFEIEKNSAFSDDDYSALGLLIPNNFLVSFQI